MSAVLAKWLLLAMLPGTVLAATLPAAAPGPVPVTSPTPSRESVFAIPLPLRQAFQREVLDGTASPEARLTRLVAFVFDERHLGMRYRADTTRTITEAYAAREVNCLTSTLLIVTLAREAGLRAHAQQVPQVLAWGASGELAIRSRHANAIVEVGDRKYTVDVDAREGSPTRALRPISDDHLLALFHGNRAMEQLLAGRTADARQSITEALRLSPQDPGLLNNAGVLALRGGDGAAAERLFLDAVAHDPGEMSALSNLVALYEARADTATASRWKGRAEQALRKDPYHQYSLGRKLEVDGRYPQAAAQYRKAIRLNRHEHLFQFALARAHAGMGDWRTAEQALSRAQALSDGATQSRYGEKLAALRRRDH